MRRLITLTLAVLIALGANAQKKKKKDSDEKTKLEQTSLSGLKFRNIGPAITSGRVADIAVNPHNIAEYYLAIASGGVWKTTNHGTTFEPIFDGQGSYSIGCVTIDPNNENVIWVGTGENNNQRSVAYGDGVYKSMNGGKNFTKMGLDSSEHIGMIKVDPRNSNVVYVAAVGPLWSAGGQRGLYKTEDGGKTWKNILEISANTGINEIHFDPRNPDVIYATAHQRRRHVWTYISGGPESAVYKSTDGGNSFEKLGGGLPGGDVGRIGFAVSPANPDVLYAIIEGHGFYRSTDRGASWSKMSGHETSGNYYVEIYAHPYDVNTIYSMDTYGHVSYDGGKTFERIPEAKKHVDNHCMWINPDNTDHMIWGCDGGVYETWDNMKTWGWKTNLPTIQFYRVAVDNAEPFYNVYGGTQDNNSLGGPSQTMYSRGIINEDWYVTNGGDGFESQIDPTDPNIVYAQAQYGWLVRFDRKSGERVPIQPQPGPDEEPYVWNWDAPLLISPHDNKTLYFAANKIFKSTDRGDSWTAISDDLSRGIDRNTLEVMGKVWSADAISYHRSTTIYGNIVSFNESALKRGLLYAGTDDGLVHVSENDGGEWTTYESFPGIPDRTYMQDLKPSLHDESTVYAVFNNHKNGDFKPYILKSSNKGGSWTSIVGNLPEKGSVYSLAEDHVNPDLLFAGTEFGLFFTLDGGKNWKQLKAGLPTIAIRDIDIQRRENDLVLASFGRGFYILDDYSPLRSMSDENLDKEAMIFPIKDAMLFNRASVGGLSYKGAQYYSAPNPPMGATFTYLIKESPKSLKAQRQQREKEQDPIVYPTAEEFRAEDNEEGSYLIFAVSDADGNEIRRMTTGYGSGVQRLTWDGRYGSNAELNTRGAPKTNADNAYFAPPGQYSVRIYSSVNGMIDTLTDPVNFNIDHMDNNTLVAADKEALLSFQKEIDETGRKVYALENYFQETETLISHLKAAARNTTGVNYENLNLLRKLENRLNDSRILIYGDASLSKREQATLPSLMNRLGLTAWGSWYTTSAPTGTQRQQLQYVQEALPDLTQELKDINGKAQMIKKDLYKSGAPLLRGDLPEDN
jgi:photosystem II stability/assembly factor-like uncharacterized protein